MQSIKRPFPIYPVPLFVKNLSHENDFDFHENEHVGGAHFHMNGFTRRFFLTLREKATRKWPIVLSIMLK